MFRRVRSRSALAWLLACALFALPAEKASASSIPLVDSSFELANNAAWNAVDAGSTSASGFPIGSPPDGTRFMLLVGYPGGGMPSISQDAGAAVPGSTYNLSFYSASRSDSSPNNIGIYGPLSALQFTASIVLRNGNVDTPIASTVVNPDLYTPGSWVQTTLSGAVPANATGNIVLKFLGTGLRGNDNQQTGIDKVVLDGSAPLPDHAWAAEGNFNDSGSIGGITGTNVDGVSFGTGRVGQAFNLSGSSQSVDLGTGVGNFGIADFSVSVWVQPIATGSNEPVLVKRAPDSAGIFNLTVQPDGTLLVEIRDNGGGPDIFYSFTGTQNLADGPWHHLALTRQGATIAVYVDGAPASGSGNSAAGLNLSSANYTSQHFIVGTNPFNQYYKGLIDEVNIYGSALSSAQVQSLYASAGGTPPPPTTYTLTASAGANGAISPSGAVSVNHGDGATFAITANAGYHIADVLVDGVSVGAVTSHSFTSVTAPHTISATFAINTYTITSSAGANGAISPSGAVAVNQDGSQTFTITPAAGYRVAGVLVDGVSVGAVRSYTFNNVTGNHTISVSFVPNPVNEVVVGAAPYFYWYYYNNWGTWVNNGGLNFLRNGSATNYSQRGYFYYQNGSYNFRRGETRPAIGDLDGDGSAEIVLGTGPGAYGNLEVFTADGAHKSWATIPWPGYNGYNGETRPAVGDLNGDGKAEVVVGLGRGGQGWVYVGNLLGTNSFTFSSSLQVPSIVPNYNSNLGETRPAVGDLDGDGRPEIVVGLGQGGNGYLAVYGSTTSGYQLRQWLQIPNPGYNSANGETRPAVGDVDGDGKAEIVVGLAQQGSGLYAIFGHTPSGYVFKRWLSAGITGWPAVGDTDGDGRAEILCGNQYQWGIGVFRGTTLDDLAFERWISTQYGPIPAIGNLVP